MKMTFEPRMGVEIYIAENGDFCFEQEGSKVYLSIGHVRGFVKKLPEMLQLADETRKNYVRENEVN